METIPYLRRSKNPKLRWRPWYPAVADWMLAHPGGKMQDCAKALGKHPSMLSMLTNSDLFKEYFAQRRAEFTKQHDFVLTTKLTMVAEKSLDILLDKLETQQDKIPMKNVTELATGVLDRLGFAPRPQTSVAVSIDNRQQSVVLAPISTAALEEARDALRAVERQKVIEHRENEDEDIESSSSVALEGERAEVERESASGVEARKQISDLEEC